MTISEKRLEELANAAEYARLAGCTYVGPGAEIDRADEVACLVRLARTGRAAWAECEESRKVLGPTNSSRLSAYRAATDAARKAER